MCNRFRKQRRNCFEHNSLRNASNGFTLAEVSLAIAIIVIAALGALCYEYLSIDHVRIARAELAATRVGQLLIEDWKSTGGNPDYTPEDLNMGFALPPNAEAGQFMTTIDGLHLFITMDSDNKESDDFAGTILREIDVTVKWNHDFSNGIPTDRDPAVVLSTYVRPDM
ncbi:MAG: prepilin-type N-terminal cleavage/methylation domain-containing protein [Sedimentisphaerales bacterium]